MPQDDQDLQNNSKKVEDYLRELGLSGDVENMTFREAMDDAVAKVTGNFEEGTCYRPWCQDMDECLWVTLKNLQNTLSERFFEEGIDEENLLISDSEFVDFIQNGCMLPEEWYEYGTVENRLITFVIEVLQALEFANNGSLSLEEMFEEESVKKFGKNLYNILNFTLKNKDQKTAQYLLSSIEDFLLKNEIFKEEDAQDFLIAIKMIKL